jgi:tRNA nucleotidyltransferase (CCA-adding enzyme)
MPDYMYLLESRLSPEQRAVLERVQELSRSMDLNIYLTGGAVRDLISGQPIRDLDFTIEGNPVRIVRELEKGGAKVASESEKLRHFEMIFMGEVDGSISAAREDVYDRPGGKPDYRFSSIMEDLRRRDFSINAIAISLNAQSRGLLLDPTNGLADLERQEVRALSIHAFTNQPVRLLRILRYSARMGAKMESRTQEWFELAMERGLNQNLEPADVGQELRAVAREDNPVDALKEWESHDLLAAIHPQLQKRKPDYDRLNKLARVRSNYFGVGIRPRLHLAVTRYILGRLKDREASAALRNLEFRAAEVEALDELVPEAQKIVKILKGRKMNAPRDAYAYLASVPPDMLAFIEVEMPNPSALSKIRAYIQKWRPMHLALPVGELDALGVPRGPKFDKILDQLFEKQLRGKGREPEERTRILRDLAGIKDEPAKKPEKKRKGKDEPAAAPAAKGPDKRTGKVPPTNPVPPPLGAHPQSRQAGAPAARSGADAIKARAQEKHDQMRTAAKSALQSSKGAKSRPAKKSRGR